jgi:ABC-2 type transport system ATP-binding protein
MSESPMIEATRLTKHYGPFVAVEEVSFEVRPGEVVAFLGPNGAGKSTTMKMLTGYLAPTSGTARIAGIDVAQDRLGAARKIGYLPENGPLYPEMTPRELLEFFGEARGLSRAMIAERIAAVAKTCALETVLDRPIENLSKGFRQRVGMSHVLLHEPEVIIMDEPTSGLDPNQIRGVREAIVKLGETKTVLLSTHILQEVEAVASRVLLIDKGRLVFDGKPAELLEKGKGNLEDAFHMMTGAV